MQKMRSPKNRCILFRKRLLVLFSWYSMKLWTVSAHLFSMKTKRFLKGQGDKYKLSLSNQLSNSVYRNECLMVTKKNCSSWFTNSCYNTEKQREKKKIFESRIANFEKSQRTFFCCFFVCLLLSKHLETFFSALVAWMHPNANQ